MLAAWVDAGLSRADFWRASPREFNAAMRGHRDRIVRDHDVAVKAAFLSARWQREKAMSPLADFLLTESGEGDKRRKAVTPDEQKAGWDALVIATGGAALSCSPHAAMKPARQPRQKRKRPPPSA